MESAALTGRFDQALAWAADLHRDQMRKGTSIPYLSHLLAVASLVLEYGGSEDQAIAGLLHDSIEDQGVTDDEIATRFGACVATIVRACTDADTQPKPPWFDRKRAYIDHLAHVDPDALIVSLADKVHNARSIASDVARSGVEYLGRFSGGAAGTRWYYRRLSDAFSGRLLGLPFDEPGRPGWAGLYRQFADVIEQFGATEEAAAEYERSRLGHAPLPVVSADGAA